MNKKSHLSGHVMVLQIFGTPKSCAFGRTFKSCLIDSTPQVELKIKEGYVKNHVKCRGSCLPKVKREEMQEFLIKILQESKLRCGLVVRLKANKF